MSQPKSTNPDQHSFLYPNLMGHLNPKHPLLQLARRIDWPFVEDESATLYSHRGKPSKLIRLMVELCVLKHLEDLNDEVLIQHWVQNPNYPVFIGEVDNQWQRSCGPSNVTCFQKRIGPEESEKVLAVCIALREETACMEIKLLKLHARFATQPKHRKKARKAVKWLYAISGCFLRALQRKMTAEQLVYHADRFSLYQRMLFQKRCGKNKLYSWHESHLYCMSKGKAHQHDEFGTNAFITTIRGSSVIIDALAFEKNVFDGQTVPAVLAQVQRLTNRVPGIGVADRGYRGISNVINTQIVSLIPARKNASENAVALARRRFRCRAGIEPIIVHSKSDHRLKRNYLTGFSGVQINLLMAVAAFNFRKWMREVVFCFSQPSPLKSALQILFTEQRPQCI